MKENNKQDWDLEQVREDVDSVEKAFEYGVDNFNPSECVSASTKISRRFLLAGLGGLGATFISKASDAAVTNWTPIGDPSSIPARYVGQIVTFWKTGDISVATGALIGPSHVLTAGHAVWNWDKGGVSPITIMFTPGATGGRAPFGSANATKWVTSNGFKRDRESPFDYGIIKLNRPLGNDRTRGWFSLNQWNVGWKYNCQINGYLPDGSSATQIATQGVLTDFIRYPESLWGSRDFPAQGGASGGPAWIRQGPAYRIIGIFTGGTGYGPGNTFFQSVRGLKMTQGVVNAITAWRANNP